MKITLKISILLFCFFTANSQELRLHEVSVEKNDTISFEIIGFNYFQKLILLKDNKFVKSEGGVSCYGGDSELKEYFGNYERNDSILILEPSYVELKTSNRNGTKRNEKLKYGTDSLKVATEFEIFDFKGYQFLVPLNYSQLIEFKIEQNERKFKKIFFNRKL